MGTVTLHPDSNISTTGWSGGYTSIDEDTADNDTTLISVSTPESVVEASFGLENSSGRSEPITDVTVYVTGRMQVDNSGGGAQAHGYYQCGIRSGGTNYFCGTSHHNESGSYTQYSYSFGATNPADSAAWAWADIDALGVAIKGYYGRRYVSKYDYSTCTPYITQVYVEVTYTDFNAPTCTTEAVSSVSYTTATGNGTITHDGNTTPSAWGICVCLASHSESPDTSDSVFAGSGAGTEAAFTASITGLSEGTAYHARAYVTNSVGTAYGATVDFTTGTQGWANIKNVRMGTGVVIATDVAHICMGTGKIDVADISDFNGVAV
jgi:hypothetical protein